MRFINAKLLSQPSCQPPEGSEMKRVHTEGKGTTSNICGENQSQNDIPTGIKPREDQDIT